VLISKSMSLVSDYGKAGDSLPESDIGVWSETFCSPRTPVGFWNAATARERTLVRLRVALRDPGRAVCYAERVDEFTDAMRLVCGHDVIAINPPEARRRERFAGKTARTR